MKTGLVSVTFRQLRPEQIVALAVQAGLDGIEWGGDIHVPHGDLETARQVRALTLEAGLEVLAYGSYFRAGECPAADFKPILETAAALGAPAVRVWAGARGSAEADEAYVRQVAACTAEICDMAAERGLLICYEYHGGTLTDTAQSAAELMERIGRDNMRLYWQPRFDLRHAENLRDLTVVLPYLYNVHAFTWDADCNRYPLGQGRGRWQDYARLIGGIGANAAMLEFVRDDEPEQMMQDAKTLKMLFEST